MNDVQVFVSFDIENDMDLYEVLLEQSQNSGSGFTVSGRSERPTAANPSSEKERRRIREADQVIIICGEHTESSVRVSVELGIAQQEETPYFLLWGRRNLMCSKPVGAKPAEGMYSWTREILQDQIAYTIRKARSDATAITLRTVRPKSGSTSSGVA
ncbi:MAG: hypothetical protein JRG80_11470 [Deltaproteobacteria bacterium]|nr:hypothetical protein [Deltaproteobacteria bacterium]MBW2399877.1 hypothetical protein [Deltaproteobacteria bacterium]MBW2665721.1 hypothetical protein [Deltaproteobacteria bacterium]